ncbi:hypothetical protein [Rhodopirellula sp. SWK7]|uniref:hypothetical protein n=1 Tax=Rhodopirellula sp. SWK7 TaxID=595460 RepID=UPI0002BEF875|nr:hypothetical protein [Rhodopirellula sp. SWK7]EMI40966.1 hypothetical protein RRSWK_06498 [Rhodopirellula sp. SWK7]
MSDASSTSTIPSAPENSSEGLAERSTAGDLHADKYNDPRAHFGWKAWASMFAIIIGGAVFALSSIYVRRTRLEETTRFWGPETITAIQLGDHVMLLPREGSDFDPVELTAFPGLGHLRRALLDERHYEWSTQSEAGVDDFCADIDDAQCVRLEFSDPSLQRFETAQVDIELNHGVVGPADQSRRVEVNERVRPALKHQIGLLMRVKQKRYDRRD